jgi:hypothetical protein
LSSGVIVMREEIPTSWYLSHVSVDAHRRIAERKRNGQERAGVSEALAIIGIFRQPMFSVE